MKTKNIQDVVDEKTEKLHYELVALMEQPEAFQRAIYTTLTQLVKEVEAGEMEKYEEAIDWIDGVVRRVAFDSETGKIWQHWLDKGKRILQALTPPTSDEEKVPEVSIGKKGIELLANIKRGKLSGWYGKPENCAHMFNYGGYMGDSEMPTCLVCNKTKAELSRLKLKNNYQN